VSPSHSSQTQTAAPFPQLSLPRSSTSRSDEELRSPHAAAALANINPSGIEMVPEGSEHRRRRSSLMNSLNTELPASAKRSKTKSPTKGGNSSSIQEEAKPGEDDDTSNSDNVELEDLSEEDGLQDDEETGLTGKDKRRIKRRKRRNTLLDHRIAGEAQITAEEKRQADQNVLKRSLVNGLLIGLWYIFSLSISIVGLSLPNFCYLANENSTTNGCSILSTSISTSRYSQRVCTCLSNFLFHHWSYWSSHNIDHDTTLYPILTIHTLMGN